jgi:fatty acid desaturase
VSSRSTEKATLNHRAHFLDSVFAHSRRDGWLVLQALFQFVTLVVGTLSLGHVSWQTSVILGISSAFLLCTNYFTIGHNFVHNAFFRNERLNACFSCFNSLLIGAPVTLHRIYHFNHHKYDNAPTDPRNGQRGDIGSTYRFGNHEGAEEPLLRYAILSFFRNDIPFLVRVAFKKRYQAQLISEILSLILMLVAFGFLNPLGLILFFLPVWLVGTIGSQAQNYLEHHGGKPGDRQHNAVSCYGRFYNWIWFNNGFHQEHHFRPQVHWTRVHEVTPLLPPEEERCVVRGAHWLNLGSHATNNSNSEKTR